MKKPHWRTVRIHSPVRLSVSPWGAPLLLCWLAAPVAHAQPPAYPSKPIRMIVPFSPGGGTDIVSRHMARQLTDRLGQQVIVDNRGGAGGLVGTETAVRAAPDGYTLIMIAASYTVNPSLYKLAYDPVKDISPVSMVGTSPSLVTVHASVPVTSIKDLIGHAKANPGKLNYGSSGIGGNTHLTTELFKLMTGTEMTHIPYKGNGPAVVDLLAGQIQIMFGSMLSLLPQAKAGKLRAIATTGAKRSAVLPEMPTVAESGVPGYEAASWYGILGPANLPHVISTRLNAELGRVVADAGVRERLAQEGLEPLHTTPAEFTRVIVQDVAKWAKVAKAAKLAPQ